MFCKATCHKFLPEDHSTLNKITYEFSGFHIKFNNCYTVSVQWGPGTRSDNKHKRSFSAYDWSSIVAEVCVFAPSEDLISISGWQTEYQVKSIVNQTSKLPTELDEDNP